MNVTGTILVRCDVCGRVFRAKRVRDPARRRRTCSRNCQVTLDRRN